MAKNLKSRLQEKASGSSNLPFDPAGRDQQRLSYIGIDSIEPDPQQPRQDPGALEELTESIKEYGLVSPIVVEPIDQRRYRILAGERRYRAAIDAGLTQLPCIVRSIDEHQRMALQLIENLHRKDLNPVEEARSFQRLMVDHNLTQETLSERLHKSVAGINQTLRILDLPEPILSEVQTSENCSKSLLLEIAKHPDQGHQQELWERAKVGQLSVRQARAAKPSNRDRPRQAPSKKRFNTQVGTVTVQGSEATLTSAQVAQALQEALRQAEGRE